MGFFCEINALGRAGGDDRSGCLPATGAAIPGPAAAGARPDAAHGVLKGAFAVSEKICVFCGGRATTRDHIPPRGIFPESFPSNIQLITVPACQKCNQGSSRDDEKFRNLVALSVSVDKNFNSSETQKEIQRPAIRSIIRSPRLHPKDIKLVPISQGTQSRQLIMWKIEYAVTSCIINKIARGLYFHHFQSILSIDKEIEIIVQDPLKKDVFSRFENMPFQSSYIVDKNIFHYKFGRVLGEDISLWLFDFYRNTKIGAITDSKRFEELNRSLPRDPALR